MEALHTQQTRAFSCICILLCVDMKPLLTFEEHDGFGSACLSFTTCFPHGWTDAGLYSPQPHDALTNNQHNDYFMLRFTPTSFFFSSSFYFSFLCFSFLVLFSVSHTLALFEFISLLFPLIF